MEEVDNFYGKIWKAGDSMVITIPSNLIKYSNFKEGDNIKVMIRKVEG